MLKMHCLFVQAITYVYLYFCCVFFLDDQNEKSVMKMKAKINFYVDKVGQHKNVMAFIGSVQDDQSRE